MLTQLSCMTTQSIEKITKYVIILLWTYTIDLKKKILLIQGEVTQSNFQCTK